MDDRDLEARLGARLHRRFDGAEPPASLTRAVVAQMATPRPRALPRFTLAGLTAAAAVLLAAVLATGGRFGPAQGGPSLPTPTVGPSASAATTTQYIVLPRRGSSPTKADGAAALDVLRLRLGSLGTRFPFTAAEGYAITFTIPIADDSPLVRDVLAATGDLAFVPLPPADYGPGALQAVIGQPLPKAEPALFAADGVASAGVATTSGVPSTVHFGLNEAATAALAAYSSAHVGDTLAILIDGKVALLPVIESPIGDGRLEVAGSPDDARTFSLLAAIVTSGPLPESWRNPRVPTVISQGRAEDVALAASGSGVPATIVSTQLTTYDATAGLEAGWAIVLHGEFSPASCGPRPPPSAPPHACPSPQDSELVIIDAVSGSFVEATVPAP